jgi:hypothetical protein
MNNKGAMPSMTIMSIGIAAFILIFTLGSSIYFDLETSNGGTISSNFSQSYAKILGYNSSLASFQENVSSDTSIWSSVPDAFSSTFNVLIAGIGGLASFFTFMTLIPSLFNTIAGVSGIAIPAAIFTFVMFVAIIYVIMKYYKAVRNAGEEP